MSGAAYFDADLNGQPGVEKFTVCDNKSDGRGIVARLVGKSGNGSTTTMIILRDPSNDGHCESLQGNWFLEDTFVGVSVEEYWTAPDGHEEYAHFGAGQGIA